jgi:voltage-gated potassium channel
MNANKSKSRWRFKLHEVIFEADTPAGKWFDVLLILAILVSVVMVMLDSVGPIRKSYGQILFAGEWLFTILFTLSIC